MNNEEQSNNNQTTNEEKNTEQQETEPDYNVVLGNYIDVNETVYATTNVNIRAFDNASSLFKSIPLYTRRFFIS